MAATDFVTESQVDSLTTTIATRAKATRTLLNGNAVDLAALTTTQKATLVAAVNDLQSQVTAAASSGGAAIDDTTASASTVYSSSKTASEISAATAALIGAAPAEADTLVELFQKDNDLLAALAVRLRFDGVQTLTAAEKTQALSNLGIVRSAVDFAAAFNTAVA